MPMIGTLNLLRVGAPGVAVVLISLFLGLALFVFRPSRALAVAGVGLCAIVLTELLNYWLLVSSASNAIATAISVAQRIAMTTGAAYNTLTDPLGLAGVGFGPGVGFYALLAGYAIMFYAYARTAGQ